MAAYKNGELFNEGNCPDNWTGEDINLVLTDMVSIEEIRVYALK